MINPISFGSTYKVNSGRTERDIAAYDKFEELCEQYEGESYVTTVRDEKIVNSSGKKTWKGEQTLSVPDVMDKDIETYCALYGINYAKSLDVCQCGREIQSED